MTRQLNGTAYKAKCPLECVIDDRPALLCEPQNAAVNFAGIARRHYAFWLGITIGMPSMSVSVHENIFVAVLLYVLGIRTLPSAGELPPSERLHYEDAKYVTENCHDSNAGYYETAI
jgi:hypothetical protein